MIRRELEYGASSARTTSTASGSVEDIGLTWYIVVLNAVTRNGGENLLAHEDTIVNLYKHLCEKTFSESGYTLAARGLSSILHSLVTVRSLPLVPLNQDEWDDPDLDKTAFLKWGKRYTFKETKLEWHTPSAKELDFAFRIVREIMEPGVAALEALLVGSPSEGIVWKNDLCRYLSLVRACNGGLGSLISRETRDADGIKVVHEGCEVPGFMQANSVIACGIAIQDALDPRHKEYSAILRRIGLALTAAVKRLRTSSQDDSIDVLKLVLRSIEIYMLFYPSSREYFNSSHNIFAFTTNIFKPTFKQKTVTRAFWVRRADFYHETRRRHVARARQRSDVDDMLIDDLCDLACSDYLRIRKSSQRVLESITVTYEGTRPIVLKTLHSYLMAPDSSHDRIKGALHTLKSKPYINHLTIDREYGSKILLALPQLQSQEKASIQELVKLLGHDIYSRAHEPVTTRRKIRSEGLARASDELQRLLILPREPGLRESLSEAALRRIAFMDESWNTVVTQFLRLAKDAGNHWSYRLLATKFLKALLRRDRAPAPDVAAFLASSITFSMKELRVYGVAGMINLLHAVKLRSLCTDDIACLLGKSANPLKRRKVLEQPLGDNFTDRFIESFRKPIDASDREETLLVDRSSTGWLVWGDAIDCYAAPPQTGNAFSWEENSGPALDRLRKVFTESSWWQGLADTFSRETERDALSQSHMDLIKSIYQIFGVEPFAIMSPILEILLAKNERDSQRAAAEMMSGLLRGMKHWSLDSQSVIWTWLTPRLPVILEGATQETSGIWETWISQCLVERDPRRCQPMVDYLTSISLEDHQDHPSMQSKAQYQVGSAMGAMSWRFLPWADKFIDQYWSAIEHPYSEVRVALAGNLRTLSEDRLHPSYSSCDAFLEDCRAKSEEVSLIDSTDEVYISRIRELRGKLITWREGRQPAYKGSQQYDRAATTITTWMWSGLTDHRVTLIYPFAETLLRELFHMQELIDNEELTAYAASVLGALAACQYPRSMVRSTATHLLDILASSVSWRVRIDLLPFLQVFYFRQLFALEDDIVARVMDQLCDLLRDPVVDVREAAAATLSGIIRCSQRGAIISLKTRFLKVVKTVRIPKRRLTGGEETPGWKDAVKEAHAGVLGACALVDAFPYEVPKWMPELLLETCQRHRTSPAPIKQTVERCLKDFKKTHQDSWHENQNSFTHDQLMNLQDLLTGSTYYA